MKTIGPGVINIAIIIRIIKKNLINKIIVGPTFNIYCIRNIKKEDK
jgi:hypothetical protein